MSYAVVDELDQLWNAFAADAAKIAAINSEHLPDIQKLMTAKSVIDLSLHEIYAHARFVHELTEKILILKNDYPQDEAVVRLSQQWLEILKRRHQIPLKIEHHQRLDGECDFRFSLQLMEGKPCGFKNIEVLNKNNQDDVSAAVAAIHRLDCLAGGVSFADLPIIKDAVLSSLMESDDVVCVMAKDQSDQIVGQCWGIMLRDVSVGKKEKANIFWVMDLARDPDFADKDAKIGEMLRAKMVEVVKQRGDCDFVGYQHVLNHKFHMQIVNDAQDDEEKIQINGEDYSAKSNVLYNDDLKLYLRSHFIRANDSSRAFPEYKQMEAEILKSFWRVKHTVKDFVVGGIGFFSRLRRQQKNHLLLDRPIDERLIAPVSDEQRARDQEILKQIILSDKWMQQGKHIFRAADVPGTVGRLQNLVRDHEFNFQALKECAANSGKCMTRGKLTSQLYRAFTIADSPTFVLNRLIETNETPIEWVKLITDARQSVKQGNELRLE